ncbi:MAG TPA: trypsin-like peptidase domain-containing protein [Propionibacteriaceae bacterium]|nr:trypsin-like peptidase domain-containing protein [Propionibacteriaceae bacterium]
MSSTEAAPRLGFLEDDDTQPIATATPDQAAPASGPIPAEWGRYPVSEVRYPPPRTPMRPITVIVVAAVTALLIGSAAGFGGARLAGVTAEPATSTAPRTSPVETAAPIPPAPRQAGTVEVAKTVVPSTVMIKSGAGSTAGTGSGFVLDIFGRIMTNNHVVEDAADGDRIDVVFSNGRRARATILGRSPSYDLAVIKVAASRSLVPIRVGDSDTVQVGETVLAVGAPLALPGTVTEGIISSRDRPVVVNGSDNADAPSAYINAIQTDAPINPGNSGGPLVDAGARVIGVNSAILTLGETRTQSGNIGLGFAIPINQAMDIGKMLIKNGRATYPVIGANVRGASGSAGVELTEVESNGPADDAGLRKGDKITAIDGRPVDAIEQLIVLIRIHRPGDVVKLTYRRGGSQDEARVTLGSKEG